MPTVEIPAGDRRKIISQPAGSARYNVEHLSGPDVHLSHRAQGTVREGKRVREGDRAQVGNLRGSPVFGKVDPAENGTAVLEVSEAGFSLDYLTGSVQKRPEDRAFREDTLEIAEAESNGLASGGSDSVSLNLSNTDQRQKITAITGFEHSGNFSQNVSTFIELKDDAGNVQRQFGFNLGQLPFTLPTPVLVPDGGDVAVVFYNDSSSTVDLFATCFTRYKN